MTLAARSQYERNMPMSKAPSRTRAWSNRRAGGSFRSRTTRRAASPRSTYQVGSNSHQAKPWRAEAGR